MRTLPRVFIPETNGRIFNSVIFETMNFFKNDFVFTHAAKLALLATTLFLFSCKEKKEHRQIERSFYYWKSVFKITGYEKQKLNALQVQTLYIKFFDVDWNEETGQPKPVAKKIFEYSAYQHFKIIPTVFITNSCIQKIDSSQIKILAENIQKLLKVIIFNHGFKDVPEVQFDCDWTASTKEKYFALLNNFKALKPNAKISATIRLHQIKFISRTGVPPVDRGLLMCYNMGNLKDPATKNSILETEELKKYIGGLAKYPLLLDIALPLFNWKVLYRNNVYTGLIQNLPETVFSNSFSTKTNNRWQVLTDTLLAGYDLRKGDIIRDEQSDYKEILSAANAVNGKLKNTRQRVSLYHLDSLILSKYTTHEMESIYNSLH